MDNRVLTLFTTVGALLCHVTLGWMWTPMAAILGSSFASHRGWVVGAIGVGVAWGLLVGFNFYAAQAETIELGRVLGGIFGGIPGIAIHMVTVVIGILLGALGGKVGEMLREMSLRIDNTQSTNKSA